MLKSLRVSAGFALPTVLIASVILLTMLTITIGAVNAARLSLQGQYYNQLAKSAAEAGLEMAAACIDEGYLLWDEPLRPGGDCLGLSEPCDSDECFIVNQPTTRTSFAVRSPDIAGDISTISSEGSTQRLRETSGQVWRTYQSDARMQDIISDTNPGRPLTWRKVASGTGYSCALASDNWVYCWGSGANGKLGNGSTGDISTPTPIQRGAIPNGVTIEEVSAGQNHTCVIGSNGSAYCWGNGGQGRLGQSTTASSSVPVAVVRGAMPSTAIFVQISAGGGSTCALASDGWSYCWGYGSDGRLGSGSSSHALSPTAIARGAMPPDATIKSVAAGYEHGCALASNKNVYCWGNGAQGRLGNGSSSNSLSPVAVAAGAMPSDAKAESLSVGYWHACMTASNGRAYCWGQGQHGRLGNNSTSNQTAPVAVSQGVVPSGVSLVSLSAAGNYTCALGSDNLPYCWGINSDGALGDNTTTQRNTPVAVLQGQLPAGMKVQQVASGSIGGCMLDMMGAMYCWGSGASGRLGNGGSTTSLTPASVAAVHDARRWPYFRDVAGGTNQLCGLDSTGELHCASLGSALMTKVPRTAVPSSVSIRQMSVGADHVCATGSNGKAYCRGLNESGALGDGTVVTRDALTAVLPGEVPGGVSIRQVASGLSHTCALGSNNGVYCWGDNSAGQLGDGTTTQRNTPVAVQRGAIPEGVGVQYVVTGGESTCALGSNKRVYCWGSNSSGQLGDGTTTQRNTPVAVQRGAIPEGVGVRQVSGSHGAHVCVVADGGQPYCWGDNSYGQLGDGTTTQRNTPVAVQRGAMPAGLGVKRIYSGLVHTCLLASDNTPYCWGGNAFSSLGNNGVAAEALQPQEVARGQIPVGVTIKRLSVGGSASCALGIDNQAYCWGTPVVVWGSSLQYAQAPVRLESQIGSTSPSPENVAAGDEYTCSSIAGGGAYCWGLNDHGQLGSSASGGYVPFPVITANGALPNGASLSRNLSAGYQHVCAVASTGGLYCWGDNASGQLGDGSTTQRSSPVAVAQGALPAGVTIRQISAGYLHTCALASNNRVYCWGDNASGQLGDGSTTQRSSPVAVAQGALPAGVTIRQISAGYLHTCALASDNRVYCWGYNLDGRIGDGTTSPARATPALVVHGAVPSEAVIESVSTGEEHSCLMTSGGKVYCWGNNASGQLGDGTTTYRTSPVSVAQGGMPAGLALRELATGYRHTCALGVNNKVYCWGNNTTAQLGDGTQVNRLSPVEVAQGSIPAGTVVRQLAAGIWHGCVVSTASEAYCWGYGFHGGIGDGLYGTLASSPRRVGGFTGPLYTPAYVFVGPRYYF